MQHHLKDLLFKDGVYDPEETVEAFSHCKETDVWKEMEGRSSRCMRLGARALTNHIPPFAICCCLAERDCSRRYAAAPKI